MVFRCALPLLLREMTKEGSLYFHFRFKISTSPTKNSVFFTLLTGYVNQTEVQVFRHLCLQVKQPSNQRGGRGARGEGRQANFFVTYLLGTLADAQSLSIEPVGEKSNSFWAGILQFVFLALPFNKATIERSLKDRIVTTSKLFMDDKLSNLLRVRLVGSLRIVAALLVLLVNFRLHKWYLGRKVFPPVWASQFNMFLQETLTSRRYFSFF